MEMSAAPGRASEGGGRPPPVRVGTAGRVVAGERVPARDLPAVLATALRRRPAQLTLDLARRSFVVTPHPGPAQIVLVPAGELAAPTLPLLSAALEAALGARPARVAIDLRHVRFIDGAGAHALVAAADRIGGSAAR